MNRMSGTQRDTIADMLEGIASDGPTGLQLDAALDAIAETMLPETTERYFEAHITVEPHEEHTFEEFAAMATEFDWRASRFDEDHVDDATGKWFMSFRHTSYERIVREVRGMVYSLQQADTVVSRYKIEETLLDSKHGDTL